MTPVGSSGVVIYGGVVYHEDADRAWRGTERDRTIAAMVRDPLIGAILFATEMFVRRVDWHVEPYDESAEAQADAEFVQQCLDDMDGTWPGDALADILTYIAWGYSVLEVVYKQRVGPLEPDLAKRSMYTDGRYGWRGWYLRPQTTRDGWIMDGDNAVAMRQRRGDFSLVEIPLDRCLYIRYGSAGGSPEGRTPLRHAYDAWYYKRNIQRIEAIGIERDLAGLPIMRVPSREIEGNTATYVAAQNIVTNIRNDAMAGAVLAGDRDQNGNYLQELTLLSTGGQRQFDTDGVIRRYANEVASALFANVLRAGNDSVGSFALSQTLEQMFTSAMGAHLDIIASAVNEQVVRNLIAVNGMDVSRCPTLKHGDIESADLQRIGEYMTALTNAGLIEDTPALRFFAHELAGLPVPSIQELEQLQAERETRRAEMERQMQQQQAPNGEQEDSPDDEAEDDAEDSA